MTAQSRPSSLAAWPPWLDRALPVVALGAFLLWGWQAQDFIHGLPNYADTLEMMWALTWYGDAVRSGQSLSVYPLAFFPAGWHYAENFNLLMALLPLHWLGGPAFAYNVAVFLSYIAAFVGSYKLARTLLSPATATVVALMYSFCGARWFHTLGHLNILVGSALIPWVLWSLDRALRRTEHRFAWLALTGLLWGASMSGSPHFSILIGVALVAWIAGLLAARSIAWRSALVALAVPAGIALLISAPALVRLVSTSADLGVPSSKITEVNFWGASLNNLALPPLSHPWLGSLASRIYRGAPFEQGQTNLGLLASVMALAGLWAARKRKEWLPVIFLAVICFVLMLGITLKWDNESVRLPVLRPLNTALWQIGHWLKPSLFPSQTPPAPFDTAVPLPAMAVITLIPFLENARVFARYALAGSMAIYLLAGFALTRVHNSWFRLALGILLVFEFVPQPLTKLPFPPEPHPAFVWLKSQSFPGESIADIVAGHPYTPVLYIEGEMIWATREHGHPTVGGASSIWPAHTAFLNQWLATREHAFWNADLAQILRYYRVRYLLLHVRGEWERGLVEEARQNPELEPVRCFDPAPDKGPWDYPICIFELLPSAHPNVNLVLEDGWSGVEDWGVWAEGTDSRAFWVGVEKAPHTLHLQAFPFCREDVKQTLEVEVNGEVLASYQWPDCEPWSADIKVPQSLVRLGRNDVIVRSGYAVRPIDVDPQKSDDTRPLSVGFSSLKVKSDLE